MVIAGIDEAGLGPVLGPLVTSMVVFEVPDGLADACLWKQLAGAVSRKARAPKGALLIDDSKKLMDRGKPDGLRHLERSVLAGLCWLAGPVGSLGDLVARVSPSSAGPMAEYPWYADGELALPTCGSAVDVELAANALRAAAERKSVRLVDIRSECVFAGQFNELIDATDNKSTTSLGVTCRLVDHLWRNTTGGLAVHVDRQGGRMRYVPTLRQLFPEARLRVKEECERLSAYELCDGVRTMRISFAVRAEQAQLPVAWASMTSKYLRELFMALVNRFWAVHVEGLLPTAGYHTDGNRFYEQIRPAMRKLDMDERKVYRFR